MIAIIGAMSEEVNAVKEYVNIQTEGTLLSLPYYVGTIDNKDVVLLQGGIGKVNTSIYLTMLFNQFNIDIVINVGSAGGLDRSQSVGDVVVASEVIHHDFDVTGFNYPLGQVPGIETLAFKCDEQLVQYASDILLTLDTNAQVGLIASGDQFICREDQVSTIKKNFTTALCCEMEAATVGHICYLFNKRFIITRSLSDVYGKGESDIQFDTYIQQASKNSAKLCYELICKI